MSPSTVSTLQPWFPSFTALHDAQLPKPLQHILIHPRQPLFLEPLLATTHPHSLLDVISHESDEVDLMHGIRVEQIPLPDILGGLGLGGMIRLGGPVETTIESVPLRFAGRSEGKDGHTQRSDHPYHRAVPLIRQSTGP
jgi:hypothetical protein